MPRDVDEPADETPHAKSARRTKNGMSVDVTIIPASPAQARRIVAGLAKIARERGNKDGRAQ